MRTLKLTLAYDGTKYAGWQVQAVRQATIQGTLQAALHRILGEPVSVIGSGRTDAGVHAVGQVASCRVWSVTPCDRLQQAFNAVLPRDIVVTRLEEAPADFHARFHARSKRYRYRIATGPVVLPFDRRYVHHVPVALRLPLMRREASRLLGRHDLRPFHKAGRPVADTRRTISFVRLARRGTLIECDIEANGFLYGMMRSIVGTLLDIGRGRLPAGTMARILKTQDRRLLGTAAPAKGLWLIEVKY